MNMKRFRILSGILVFIIFFLLIVTVILLFLVILDSGDNNNGIPSPEIYKISEIDFQRNTTSYSFVSLPKKLSNDEFISYRKKSKGSYVIINSFGGKEYQCSGSCYCRSNSRRIVGSVLSRSLYLLVSAFSASVAISMSEKMFRENCVDRFSDICDSSDIISEVAKCSEREEESENENEESKEEEVEHYLYKPQGTIYECSGYCVPNSRHKSEEAKEVAKGVDCKGLTNKGIVVVFHDEPNIKPNARGHYAKVIFIRDYQRLFCKEGSVIEYQYKNKWRKVMKSSSACVSQSKATGYSNINCFKLPEEEQIRHPDPPDWFDLNDKSQIYDIDEIPKYVP